MWPPRRLGMLLISICFFFAVTTLLLHVALDRFDDNSTDFWNQLMALDGLQQQPPKKKQKRLRRKQSKNLIQGLLQDTRPAHDSLKLKREYEKKYSPSDRQRIMDYVKGLRQQEYQPATQPDPDMPYDIHNCPPEPPKDYPFAWNILNVIENWNPDNTTAPARIYQGLCVFDWDKDLQTAERYREAEVPFIIQNNPVVLQTSERWNRDENYLLQLLGEKEYKTEYSTSNHLMWWKNNRGSGPPPEGWKEPTEITKLTYKDWLNKARALQVTPNQTSRKHWYFRLNAAYQIENHFVYQELPIFEPKKSFFMVDPSDQRGINCRFGMKGNIAEMHYDQSRNFIVVLGGARRYILAHPRECPHMELYPQGHPSGRHSAVDWSDPDVEKHPQFAKGMVNEVVLQAGDALYLPTSWLHFIVSLNLNYQCNARSGITHENRQHIQRCGFG